MLSGMKLENLTQVEIAGQGVVPMTQAQKFLSENVILVPTQRSDKDLVPVGRHHEEPNIDLDLTFQGKGRFEHSPTALSKRRSDLCTEPGTALLHPNFGPVFSTANRGSTK